MDPDPKRNVAVECFQIDTTVRHDVHRAHFDRLRRDPRLRVHERAVPVGDERRPRARDLRLLPLGQGEPDTHAQGDYDDLTVWEQLDGGASWSATKKVFLIVPTLVLLAYLNAADFSRQALTIHVPIYALLCILPKLHWHAVGADPRHQPDRGLRRPSTTRPRRGRESVLSPPPTYANGYAFFDAQNPI